MRKGRFYYFLPVGKLRRPISFEGCAFFAKKISWNYIYDYNFSEFSARCFRDIWYYELLWYENTRSIIPRFVSWWTLFHNSYANFRQITVVYFGTSNGIEFGSDHYAHTPILIANIQTLYESTLRRRFGLVLMCLERRTAQKLTYYPILAPTPPEGPQSIGFKSPRIPCLSGKSPTSSYRRKQPGRVGFEHEILFERKSEGRGTVRARETGNVAWILMMTARVSSGCYILPWACTFRSGIYAEDRFYASRLDVHP